MCLSSGVIYLCYGGSSNLGAYVIALLYECGVGAIVSLLLVGGITCILSYFLYHILLSRLRGALLSEALLTLPITLIVRDISQVKEAVLPVGVIHSKLIGWIHGKWLCSLANTP